MEASRCVYNVCLQQAYIHHVDTILSYVTKEYLGNTKFKKWTLCIDYYQFTAW
jgi:hypothetical protein